MELNQVLIVDDSKTSRMITKHCFEIAVYYDTKFFEAEDGLRAVSFLEENKVDLVLSDLNMPRMDGATFIRKLKSKEKTRAIPVFVISSMGNDLTEQQLREQGVQAVIRKPINPEKVIEALGDLS